MFCFGCRAGRWSVLSLFVLFALGSLIPESQADERPNILLILADDMGFSDAGCYGSEIETPNLDRLAEQGIRFSNFYNTGRCWPTRSSMLTGYYAQQVTYDTFPGEGRPKRNRPDWAPLISQVLSPQGYRCYHSGKWHLDRQPVAQGFDHSYRLADHGRFFSPKNHQLDGKPLAQPDRDAGYYATSAIADYMIQFLEEHQEEHSATPFFAFVAFTSPHFPLHALPEDIEKYAQQYQQGWNQVRQERLDRMEAMGLLESVRLSQVEPEVGPPYHFPDAMEKLGPGEVNRPLPWQELNEEQKSFQTAKMRIHAAMVDRMDQEIGRLVQQLEKMGQTENTLLMFLSDNGASAEIMVRSDGHDPDAIAGSAATHLCLGPGWSNAANTPFRRHKTWVHEGGIRTPLIVHWPAGIKQAAFCRQVGHVVDIFPTVMEVAGAEVPEATVDRPGTSLLKVLTSEVETEDRELWWLHEGNSALRDGDWKLVRSNGQPWQLFDVANDPTEQIDLIQEMPERASAMRLRWEELSRDYQADSKQGSKP